MEVLFLFYDDGKTSTISTVITMANKQYDI